MTTPLMITAPPSPARGATRSCSVRNNKQTPNMIHDLKTDPIPFEAVDREEKTFEIRKNDRSFMVGDILLLRQTHFTGEQMHFGDPLEYTGKEAFRIVTHILHGPGYGLANGYVILSMRAMINTVKVSREDAEIESIMSRLREAMSSDALEGCAPSEAVTLLINQRDNWRNDNGKLWELSKDLLEIAKHTHVNSGVPGDDSCKKCGLDLRHTVHRRIDNVQRPQPEGGE